jgi:hypothetical protein
MTISRRVFFSALVFVRTPQTVSLRAAVLETFVVARRAHAVLVHHAEPSARQQFAKWLQTRSGSVIRVRTSGADEVSARIFRVRMCFGRGLILLDTPIHVQERDVITIE